MSRENELALAALQAAAERETARREAARLRASLRYQLGDHLLGAVNRPAALPGALLTLPRLAGRLRRARLWQHILSLLDIGALNTALSALPVPQDLGGLRALHRMVTGRKEPTPYAGSDPALQAAQARLMEMHDLARTGIGVLPAGSPGTPARTALYLVNDALPMNRSGYTVRSQAVSCALRAAGHDVRVLALARFTLPGAVDRYELDGVPHSLLPAAQAPAGVRAEIDYLAGRIEDEARRLGAALIHAASNWRLGWAGLIAARRLGVPFFYEVRGFWEITRASVQPGYEASPAYKMQVRLESDIASAADLVFTLNRAMAEALRARGAEAGRIAIVPNGTGPASQAEPPAAAVELRERSPLMVALAGALTPYEGVPRLIDAMARVNAKRSSPVGLLIAGGGPAEAGLRSQLASLGSPDWAVMTGSLPPEEAAACYRLADIAAFPREDLAVTRLVQPIKPVEAMAHGAAVVMSDLPALTELGGDGTRARLVPPGDTAALASAIAALADDGEARGRLAEAGRNWAREQRSWARVTAPLVEAYASVLPGK